MNNLVSSPGFQIDPDDLADILISREELDRITKDRRAEQARIRRRKMWKNGALISIIGVQSLTTAGLLAFIWVRPPQTVPEPIWIYQKDDGTVTNYASWNSLPDRVKNDDVVNVVTNYVQLRESWSEGNAGYAWRTISALSSPNVRAQFQQAWSKDNPDSPVRQYKDGTTVEARYVNWMPVCPIEGCSGAPDAYRIWFDRYETVPGHEPGLPTRYAVTVRIKRNIPLPASRLWERFTFNAPLIQVVDYPTPQKDGIR